MERYTADEALTMITDSSGLADDGESDIEEDLQDDEPEEELHPARVPSPSPTPLSHSLPSASAANSSSSSTPSMQQAHSASKHSALAQWEPVSPSEMEGFLGIVLNMGLVDMPEIQDYWSTTG